MNPIKKAKKKKKPSILETHSGHVPLGFVKRNVYAVFGRIGYQAPTARYAVDVLDHNEWARATNWSLTSLLCHELASWGYADYCCP